MERKVVFVTGSSRGIGLETIRYFAKNNYDVVIHYFTSKEEALSLKNEVENNYNVNALVVNGDISNEDDVKRMVEDIRNTFSKVDVLVNNAGIAKDSLFEDKSIEDFKRVLDVNLVGTFIVSREVFKLMDKGVIINVSSTNGIDTVYPESIDYDASKAGVISLTHNLAKVFAPDIRVNAICPGWVDTSMNRNLDDEFKNNEMNKILLKRFANPEEIAESIYYMSQMSYLNDAIVRVDGGESA